jgi:hypothetical protein
MKTLILLLFALGALLLLSGQARRYFKPGPGDQEGDEQDWPDTLTNEDEANRRKVLPYSTMLILSGPFKRRTYIYGANKMLEAAKRQVWRMRLFFSRARLAAMLHDGSDEPDTEFLENLNNI